MIIAKAVYTFSFFHLLNEMTAPAAAMQANPIKVQILIVSPVAGEETPEALTVNVVVISLPSENLIVNV